MSEARVTPISIKLRLFVPKGQVTIAQGFILGTPGYPPSFLHPGGTADQKLPPRSAAGLCRLSLRDTGKSVGVSSLPHQWIGGLLSAVPPGQRTMPSFAWCVWGKGCNQTGKNFFIKRAKFFAGILESFALYHENNPARTFLKCCVFRHKKFLPIRFLHFIGHTLLISARTFTKAFYKF